MANVRKVPDKDGTFKDFQAVQEKVVFSQNRQPVFAAQSTKLTTVNIQNAQNVVHQGVLNVTVDGSGRNKKMDIKPKKPITISQAKPSQNQLMDIKEKVGPDWKDMGRRLEFEDSILEQMKLDHPQQHDELIYQILRRWIQRENEKATREKLATVFLRLKRGDLADILAEDD